MQDKLIGKKKLVLTGYLDLKERPYLVPKLDKVRSEARKSVNEFGMNPLRLVIAFLRWTNFKEHGNEKMSSPLLLVPVSWCDARASRTSTWWSATPPRPR